VYINLIYANKSNPVTGLERPLGVQEVEAHEGGKFISPMHWPALSPRRYPWYSFLLKAASSIQIKSE